MTILVTGAGLIGTYTARQLTHLGREVLILDAEPHRAYINSVVGQPVTVVKGRVENLTVVRRLLKGCQLDAIIHSAAIMKPLVDTAPWNGFQTNVAGAAAMVEYARSMGISKFIYCSSLAVYDFGQVDGPITEESPTSLGTLYENTKLLAEKWLQAVARKNDMQLTILRLSGTYGAGLFRGGAWMGQRLQNLVLDILRNPSRHVILNESEFGTNEYLYVKDAAAALCNAIQRTDHESLICNIGAGTLTATEDLVDALIKCFPRLSVCYNPACDEELPNYLKRTYPLDITRARAQLRYAPVHSDFFLGLYDYIRELSRMREMLVC